MKKLLLALICVLFLATSAWAISVCVLRGGEVEEGGPFSHEQGNSASGDAGSSTIQVTLNSVTSGSLLVVWVKGEMGDYSWTFDGCTSSIDGAFIEVAENHHSGNAPSGCFYYLASASAGNHTITATFSRADIAYRRIIVSEFSYSGTCQLDVNSESEGTDSAAVSSGNVTTTGTYEVCVAGYGEGANTTTSSEQIGGVAATEPAYSGVANTSLWYRMATVSNDDASATVDVSSWVCSIACFKTN